MKKIVILTLISLFINANSLPADMVCKKVNKSDVEEMMGVKYKEQKVGKLPFDAPYDVSFCNYVNKELPEFSIYYFGSQKSYDSVIAPFDDKKELKELGFDAQIAISKKDKKVVQLVAKSKKGVISFRFENGLKDNNYTKALEYIKKLREEFE